ncbi:hypothetical protein [Streptomyces tsukubensis]|nr:hypothetical protein [Streptomyces tsukubensis]QFR95674.1 hypothetical protein GBW32_24895 [Streptomyces tsukubensis]
MASARRLGTCFGCLSAAPPEVTMPFEPPQWAKPGPLGYAQAADAAHFVAAPLLASASAAMVGVVSADGEKFRWPGAAVLALALALLSLVGSIQFGFHARALLYSVGDLENWWGQEDLADRRESLRLRQRQDLERWKAKIDRAVWTYNMGVALLGAGVSLCAAPATRMGEVDAVFRWLAFGVLGAGSIAEFGWALFARRPVLWRRRPGTHEGE